MHTNSLGVNKPNSKSASESAKQEQSVSTVLQPAFSLTSGLYCKRKSMVWKTFLTELMQRVLGPRKIIKMADSGPGTSWIDLSSQR